MHDHRQRLQVGTAVVVHDALGTARSPARVIDREQVPLVGGYVLDGRITVGERLVFRPLANRADLRARSRDGCCGEIGEIGVAEQEAGARVADDVAQLVSGEPHVEGDEHGAGERHGVVRLEQDMRVGREDRHPLSRANAGLHQAAGETARPIPELGIGELQWPVHEGSPVGVDQRRPAQERDRGQHLGVAEIGRRRSIHLDEGFI